MQSVETVSPDRTKSLFLAYDGEARFGPEFFQVTTRGFSWPLGPSTIGEDVRWSADSKYVVVLVFRSRDTSLSPNVELVAIDTALGRAIVIDRNTRGLIHQLDFLASGEYECRYFDHGNEEVRRWTPG
jgi:hypothetical protein